MVGGSSWGGSSEVVELELLSYRSGGGKLNRQDIPCAVANHAP